MNLSVGQLRKILSTATDMRTEGRADEKRRAARVEFRATLGMALNGAPAERLTTTVRDLSCRGVGLLHREALGRGTQFIIYLPRPDQEPLAILCGVMHCREVTSGLYAVGAEFVTTVNEAPPPAGDDAELERIRNSILD